MENSYLLNGGSQKNHRQTQHHCCAAAASPVLHSVIRLEPTGGMDRWPGPRRTHTGRPPFASLGSTSSSLQVRSLAAATMSSISLTLRGYMVLVGLQRYGATGSKRRRSVPRHACMQARQSYKFPENPFFRDGPANTHPPHHSTYHGHDQHMPGTNMGLNMSGVSRCSTCRRAVVGTRLSITYNSPGQNASVTFTMVRPDNVAPCALWPTQTTQHTCKSGLHNSSSRLGMPPTLTTQCQHACQQSTCDGVRRGEGKRGLLVPDATSVPEVGVLGAAHA